jgi:predicted NUDIX family phosphoesterase
LNTQEEYVLCFESKLLSQYSGQKVFYTPFLWDRIQKSLVPLPRSKVEQDKRYKQLVAYDVIKSGNSYLTYKRTEKGEESRLWKKYSLGVGGHINYDDKKQSTLFDSGFFVQAVQREIEEEIVIDPPYVLGKPSLKCFINDDSDDVGRVHFGLVWLSEIKYPKGVRSPSKAKGIVRGKKGLAELKFCDIDALKASKSDFETWSQLIIDYLSRGKIL